MREKSKFIFTKGLNEIFNNLISLGKEIKISRSDLQFLDIKNILNYFSKLENQKLKETFKQEIRKNKRELKILKQIKFQIILKVIEIFTHFLRQKLKLTLLQIKIVLEMSMK